MKTKILLNPYSHRWNAKEAWKGVDAALRAAGVDFDLSVSERADHLVELAADAVREGFTTLIVAGGDGSIGEVINGATVSWNEQSQFPITFGVIPIGTANDFAHNIGLPLDFHAVASMIKNGKTRMIDLGKCNDRYFLNNSAIGLEPYVTINAEKIKWISGVPRYLVAAVQTIMEGTSWNAKIEWDDDAYDGPIILVSVGNGKRTGGFFMTPHADPFDGKLTFIHGYKKTRTSMLFALPSALKVGKGNIAEQKGIHELHSTTVCIHLDRPSPVHTDGELFDKWATDFEYKIFPAVVPIIMP